MRGSLGFGILRKYFGTTQQGVRGERSLGWHLGRRLGEIYLVCFQSMIRTINHLFDLLSSFEQTYVCTWCLFTPVVFYFLTLREDRRLYPYDLQCSSDGNINLAVCIWQRRLL